jgi:hypothetical protein
MGVSEAAGGISKKRTKNWKAVLRAANARGLRHERMGVSEAAGGISKKRIKNWKAVLRATNARTETEFER